MSGYLERVVVDAPTVLLSERSLDGVAEYIKSGKVKKIVVMSGAGISTAAGIPDFRTPGTGLYSRLQELNLPYPEAISEISYFRTNPLPFYFRAQMIHPDKYQPTFTHHFLRVLHDRGLLYRSFTQNIDTLERKAGVPEDKIIECHGSFANQHCIDCHAAFPHDLMRKAIDDQIPAKCLECGGLVKPDIVFYGESLPQRFWDEMPKIRDADLVFVIGTSLKVTPFSGLPQVCEDIPRVLFNKEQVGTLGMRPDDVVYLGSCDNATYLLAKSLGWVEDVEKLYGKAYEFVKEDGEGKETTGLQKGTIDMMRHELLEEEAEAKKLELSPKHMKTIAAWQKQVQQFQAEAANLASQELDQDQDQLEEEPTKPASKSAKVLYGKNEIL